MQNIDLNLGGLIGAVAGGAIAGFVYYSYIGNGENERVGPKLIIVAVIGGAFAGNSLWANVTKRDK